MINYTFGHQAAIMRIRCGKLPEVFQSDCWLDSAGRF